jgi:hypothetical protein
MEIHSFVFETFAAVDWNPLVTATAGAITVVGASIAVYIGTRSTNTLVNKVSDKVDRHLPEGPPQVPPV